MSMGTNGIGALALACVVLSGLANATDGVGRRVPFADPFVLRHGDTYYAYGTCRSETGIGVAVSKDLKTWRWWQGKAKDGFALHKDDAFGAGGFWAPEVYALKNGKFLMLHSADLRTSWAEADSPLGPFRNPGKKPYVTQKSIDNSLFIDDDGKAYMFFVWMNPDEQIWSVRLSDDLKSTLDDTWRFVTATLPDSWETKGGWLNEGPMVVKVNGTYVLTYSAGDYKSPHYGVGYATATDIRGPWRKSAANPVLCRLGGMNGTGHHSLFKDAEGKWKIVFHAHAAKDRIHPRCMYVADVAFSGSGHDLKMSVSKTFTTCEKDARDLPTPVTAVVCDSPAGVVRPSDRPVLRLKKGFKTEGLAWSLADWRDRPVASGVWPADGVLTLGPLPAGYYDLVPRYADGTDIRKTTLAVVADADEKLPKDSFFAIMTALSCVAHRHYGDTPWFDGDWARVNADLLAVLGIPNAREIVYWPANQPKRDATPRFSKSERHAHDLLSARGIGIDPFFEKAPAWAGVGKDMKLARDLKAIYDYSKWAVADLGDRASSWEYWNEEDLHGYSPESAWDYASTLKAAYLGMKAANPRMPVLHGAFCQTPFTAYNRLLYANDATRYSDIVNYHSYSPLQDIPGLVRGVRRLMAEAGVPDRAIWFTELNTNQEGNSTEESVRRGMKAHSSDQEKVVVEHAAKAEIAMMMAGVARTFYFILPGLNERNGAKDWGLTRRDGTVKPAYAALATLVRRVGTARLDGEVKVGEGLKAYLFTHADGRQTLVCWAVSNMELSGGEIKPHPLCERVLTLPGNPQGELAVYDACGHRSKHDAAKPLTVCRYATYVTGLRGLKADVPPVPAGKVDIHSFAADEDPAVVVMLDNHPDDFSLGANKTLAEMNCPSGRVTVTVWNLDDRAKTGSLAVSGGTFVGLPGEIALPAWGKAAFDVRLVPDRLPAGGTVMRVTVGGVFDGRKITRLVMPVRATAELMAEARIVEPAIADLSHWKRNDSAKTQRIVWDEGERAIRMDFAWDPSHGDRWFYPRYELQLPAEACNGALVVEYEARMKQDKVENDVNFSHVMIVRKGEPLEYCNVMPAARSWEKRRISVPEGRFDGIAALQFGCGPKGFAATFWIRNVRVYCRNVGEIKVIGQ